MAGHAVLGISFDHMHMGDLLRRVDEHPVAGIFDAIASTRRNMPVASGSVRSLAEAGS